MSRTTPKGFQQAAVESSLSTFSECRRLLDIASNDSTGRSVALAHHGVLLLEAPTGAGKTLVAGHLAERFSEQERLVWFWFAPFKGVVGQTAATLRRELPGLRLRELSEDRNAGDSRNGDVWVTTWQTVATRVKDRRNVHIRGEQNLTVEELIDGLRAQGLRIGVVIDEAHHGFFSKATATQAMEFFRRTLRPEYTVLVTATPDDAELVRFEKEIGLAKVNRVTISRREPVDEGLVKEGIKCVAYLAPEEQKALVDFQRTALREGAALHHAMKAELKRIGVALVPLMLVQVDSRPGSVERAREQVLAAGFADEQIAVHTADEPDAGLLAIADDETREVLVFKMAVALGFDAPRASVLVSMRAAKDEDFGVQLVGRIMRVHRRLQGRARARTLPELLRHGYVFLADAEAQEGLDKAGQRMNKLQTEYGAVSPTTTVVRIAGQTQVQILGPGGQTHLFTLDIQTSAGGAPVVAETGALDTINVPDQAGTWHGTILELISGGFSTAPATSGAEIDGTPREVKRPAIFSGYRYKLRTDVPRRFKTQVVSPDNDATEEDCAQRFIVSTRDIVQALAAKVKVQAKTQEVFTGQIELEFINAEMHPDEAARKANKALQRDGIFDARELRLALLRKLAATLREMGLDGEAANGEKLRHMLNVILTGHPELLFEAQKASLAAHFEVEDTEEEIPEVIESEEPLTISRLNMYGTVPSGLNSWERAFAATLDGDGNKIVRWWHRNLPHKPWSVQVVLADGRGFFPDFIIGVNGRKKELGALLADTKFAYELAQEQPKSYAEHPIYGRVLILSREGTTQWMTVRFDPTQKRAVLDKEFRLLDAPGF